MCISLRKKSPRPYLLLFYYDPQSFPSCPAVVVCIDLRWAWWLKCIFHFPVYSFSSLFSSHSLRTPALFNQTTLWVSTFASHYNSKLLFSITRCFVLVLGLISHLFAIFVFSLCAFCISTLLATFCTFHYPLVFHRFEEVTLAFLKWKLHPIFFSSLEHSS